jgi:hypothetical protein
MVGIGDRNKTIGAHPGIEPGITFFFMLKILYSSGPGSF